MRNVAWQLADRKYV